MWNKEKAVFVSRLIKFFVLVFSVGYIYRKLFIHKSSEGFWQILANGFESHAFLLFFVILLMVANWLLEAVKWRFLIRHEEEISLKESIKAVLAGVSISILTPNRVGEFAGKIFFLKHANRKNAIFINTLGSLSQFLVTFIVGGIAIFDLLMDQHSFLYGLAGQEKIRLSLTITSSIVALLFIVYYTLPWFSKRKFIRLNWFFEDGFRALTVYNFKQLSFVLFLSFARYVIFSIQYYLLLLYFDIQLQTLDAFLLIAATFFLVSVIPTYALTELGVRGSVALFLFGMYSDNEAAIVFSSLGLWLVNLGIPALSGAYFILQLKIFRQE